MHDFVVLTGGPGGGKTTLVQELARDPAWRGRFLALPEAIVVAGRTGVSPDERLFQHLMVEVQRALEDALDRALGPAAPRLVLCHRGSLDPLAYWLDRGWSEDAFFAFTRTTREEHYRRYTAVIQLVTAADGAAAHYSKQQNAHRPEGIDEAIRLDGLLERVWCAHPRYYRLDNEGRDWAEKSAAARHILSRWLLEDQRSIRHR